MTTPEVQTLLDDGSAIDTEGVAWREFEQRLAVHPRRDVIEALAEVHFNDVDEEMGAGMRWHLRRAHAVVEALPELSLRADR